MHKWYKRILSLLVVLIFTLACSGPVYAKTEGNGTLVYTADNDATFDPGGATYSRIIC